MPGAWVPPGARQRPALDLDQVKSSIRCQTPRSGHGTSFLQTPSLGASARVHSGFCFLPEAWG